MISYIVDEDGIKTHAVVPIREWQKIKEENFLSTVDIISYPDKHVEDTIEFLKTLENLSVDEWKKSYEEHYSYYNKLDIVDFMVLYLFRSGKFGTIFGEEIEQNIDAKDTILFDDDMFMSTIRVIKKDGSPLDWGMYSSIRKKIGVSSEQEFLSYFHSKMKFDNDSIEYFKNRYKRLHRNAEKDRLFVYDLHVLFSDNWVKISYEDTFKKPEEIAKYLAKYLYNENISQVYRASKEAQDRIDTFK